MRRGIPVLSRLSLLGVGLWAFLGCSGASGASGASGRPTERPVVWTSSSSVAHADTSADVRLTAAIERGWHIYAIDQAAGGPVATHITLAAGQPFALAGPVRAEPQPSTVMDSSFGLPVRMHQRAVTFIVPIRRTAPVAAAADSVHLDVRFQACDATLCLPPQTGHIASALAVRHSPAAGSARTSR